jgi:hypothetical protein
MASRRVGRKHGPISPAALNKRAQERCRKAILPARGAYLRACTYYHAPLFMMDPANLLFREHWRKMQACFRQAAALFDPPFEAVEVPYQGKTLPGYLCRAEHDRGRRRTLIIVGGIETFAEDLYFMAAPAALSRGFNVLAVDLPGQGLNPDAGLFLEARADRGVLAVVDYAAAHPEVDGDYLVQRQRTFSVSP